MLRIVNDNLNAAESVRIIKYPLVIYMSFHTLD